MSVYLVRNKVTGLYLTCAGSCVCGDIDQAHVFTAREEAGKEAKRWDTWREVVEVFWRLSWFTRGRWEPLDNEVERRNFDSPNEARASVMTGLLYGSGGRKDSSGYKVVRVRRSVRKY
jgi:hypothetical protein